MTTVKSQTGNVEVTPVSWLDASTFAEVSESSDKSKVEVFISKDVDISSDSVKSRISRLVGNFTNRKTIGDVEQAITLDVA